LTSARYIEGMKRSPDAAKRNPGFIPQSALVPDCAEPVIGRRFAPTRWLHPGYLANNAAVIHRRNRLFRNRCGILPLSGVCRPDQFRFIFSAKYQLNPALSC
jgi:hypothetical protein